MSEIINFQPIINKYIEEPPNFKNHFLAPQGVFRLCIIGPSGSGKTNILINLLLKYLYYDKIYLYAKDLEEDKYQFLIEFYNTLSDKLSEKNNINDPILIHGSNIDDVIDVDELDPTKQNIIIFDDFVTESEQKKIEDLFIRARKKNTSIIYLTQSYFKTPKTIRLQCNYFILMNVTSKKELIEIAKDHATNIDHKEFLKLYSECMKNEYCFLMIDKKSPYLPLQYRMNFNGLYYPKKYIK